MSLNLLPQEWTSQPQSPARLATSGKIPVPDFVAYKDLALGRYAAAPMMSLTGTNKNLVADALDGIVWSVPADASNYLSVATRIPTQSWNVARKSFMTRFKISSVVNDNYYYWYGIDQIVSLTHSWTSSELKVQFINNYWSPNSYTFSITAGKWYTLIGTVDYSRGDANIVKWYLSDGQTISTATVTNNSTLGSTTGAGTYKNNATAKITSGRVGMSVYWHDVALPESIIYDLLKGPQNQWQIFEPEVFQIFVPDEAGGGVSGSLSSTLGALTSSATGTVKLQGTLSKTLGNVTSAATGTVALKGTLSKTLSSATLVSTGTIVANGTGVLSQTLGTLVSTATGTVLIQGTLSQTLDATTLASTGELTQPGSGTLSQTLGNATLSATSTLALKGTASVNLDALGLNATSAILVKGVLTQTLENTSLLASGGELSGVSGVLSQTLENLVLSAAGGGLWSEISPSTTLWAEVTPSSTTWTEI